MSVKGQQQATNASAQVKTELQNAGFIINAEKEYMGTIVGCEVAWFSYRFR